MALRAPCMLRGIPPLSSPTSTTMDSVQMHTSMCIVGGPLSDQMEVEWSSHCHLREFPFNSDVLPPLTELIQQNYVLLFKWLWVSYDVYVHLLYRQTSFVYGRRYSGETLTAHITDGSVITDYGTFTLWCRAASVFFTRISIPTNLFSQVSIYVCCNNCGKGSPILVVNETLLCLFRHQLRLRCQL